MLLGRSPMNAIDEGELDVLLLAALLASPHNRGFVVEKITGLSGTAFVGAWHDVCANGGESDVLALVAAPTGELRLRQNTAA